MGLLTATAPLEAPPIRGARGEVWRAKPDMEGRGSLTRNKGF